MEANQTTQPTKKAASIGSTFLANAYAPPDSGNRVASSAKLNAVIRAMLPLRANARIAAGPVTAKATPVSARMPPPTMAPTPTPVAPRKPIDRSSSGRPFMSQAQSVEVFQ